MHLGHAGRTLLVAAAALVALLIATPSSAQTGMVKGKVTDGQNQPIEGAKVTILFADGMNRKFETKTNKKGEFIQIGLAPGNYKVMAEKDGMSQAFDARVRLGDAATVNFQLGPGMSAGAKPMTKEEAAKLDALKKALDAGLAANQGGNYDEAITQFTAALAARPECVSCYYNIGFAHARKKEYDQAEVALKKAIELKPDTAEAYNELATLYNAQKKFDLAAQMSAEAAKYSGGAAGGAGGNAEMLYNQGVILWNAGKVAEAKKNFEDVIKTNPAHADAHYQLGMAFLNEGKMTEAVAMFEKYLELAPTGQYAAQAKGIVGQLKK